MKSNAKPNNTLPNTRFAVCRSCGCRGDFQFAGTQHIPAHVAKKLGMGIDQFNLWNCPNCGTTLSEMNLT